MQEVKKIIEVRVSFAVYDYVKVNQRRRKKFLYFVYRNIISVADKINEAVSKTAEDLSAALNAEAVFWKEVPKTSVS